MQRQQERPDYAQLDDAELFAECRHVRQKIESLPACHAGRGPLETVLGALTDEFDRRARLAWTAAARREP